MPRVVQSWGGVEGPRGLRERKGRVVVRQGHGLLAAVNDRRLGKRRDVISDLRAALAVGQAVDPGLPDRGLGVDIVVVALEIIDDREFLGREAPDVARIGAGVADLVDLPEVLRPEQSRSAGV